MAKLKRYRLTTPRFGPAAPGERDRYLPAGTVITVEEGAAVSSTWTQLDTDAPDAPAPEKPKGASPSTLAEAQRSRAQRPTGA